LYIVKASALSHFFMAGDLLFWSQHTKPNHKKITISI
jgi:hypothetical protein